MTGSQVIRTLEEDHRNSALHLRPGEEALLRYACTYLRKVDCEPTLVRHVVYFLSHCGANLSQMAIALATERTDRNVREIGGMTPEAFRKSVTFSPKESAGAPPKIPHRLVPLITEYLLTHEVTSKPEILRFLREEQQLSVCRDTLNALLREYHLDRLLQPRPSPTQQPRPSESPLFSAAPASPALG